MNTSLDALAAYAEIFGAIVVIFGGLFALLQWRRALKDKRDSAAVALLTQSLQDPRLFAALRRVRTATDDQRHHWTQFLSQNTGLPVKTFDSSP